jgi:threonine aldolase
MVSSDATSPSVAPANARARSRALADRADAVIFLGDGAPSPPASMITRLAALEAAGALEPDDYSLGGSVEALERRWAEVLDKEGAIWLPTGTLANHLAVRRLCGDRPRVIVQEQSHLYHDEGDALARLSGISAIPLAHGRVCFTVEELEAAFDEATSGRVLNPVGAVVVETPVRRQYGQVVPFDDLHAIADACRARGVGTHLDGARMYMMSAATGVPIADYAALFDTVYVSLWKYFGAPFGAILAGSAAMIDGLYHDRRMFGGGLPSAYLAAALALDGMTGFEERFGEVMARSRDLCARLATLDGLTPMPFLHGSNIVPVAIGDEVDAQRLADALFEDGIVIGDMTRPLSTFRLTFNPTLLRRPTEALAASFAQALEQSRR